MKFVKVVLTTLLCILIISGLACTGSPAKSGSGCYFEYQADLSSIPQQNQSDYLNNTMQILEKRLVQYGTQFQIIRSGTDRISIYIPDCSNPESVNQLVGTTARLVFMELASGVNTSVSTAVSANDRVVRVENAAGFSVGDMFYIGSGATYEMQTIASIDTNNVTVSVTPGFSFNHNVGEQITNYWTPATGLLNGVPTVLTGKYLLPKCAVVTNTVTNQPEVQFQWDTDGANLFSQITGNLIGKPLGIALDNVIISQPTVQAQISDTGAFAGLTSDEARNLVIQLNEGALPLHLENLNLQRYLFWSGKSVAQNGSALNCTFDLSDIPGDKTEDKLDYVCKTIISNFKNQSNIEPCIYVMEPVGNVVSVLIYLPIQLPDEGRSIMGMLSLSHDILETYYYTVFDTSP